MEIKVIHACGTKFVFDVEPENGAMPFAIQCPSCGQDATEDANAIIAQTATAAAPAASPPPPPPPANTKPGLSLGNTHAKPAATPATKTESAPPLPPAPAPAAAKPAKMSGSVVASDEPHLPLAITGAFIGAAIGMGIWYVMVHYLHFASGWVAWGTGVLAGFGTRALGRAPTMMFGAIAAVFALLAIIGGAYLGLSADVDAYIAKETKGTYEKAVQYAKNVTGAKDDEALKAVLAEDRGAGAEITAADLTKVKAELPRLKQLAEGKPAKAEFDKQLAERIRSTIDMGDVMKESFNVFFYVCILLGIASAFKLGSGMGS